MTESNQLDFGKRKEKVIEYGFMDRNKDGSSYWLKE